MTETISRTIESLPDTPVGRQLRWYLTMLLRAGEGASLADLPRYSPGDFDLSSIKSDADVRHNWKRTAEWLGPILSVTLESASETEARILYRCAKEREFRQSFAVEMKPPHRIVKETIERLYDFKLETRDATESDAGILAELERRCPIVLGDTKIWFDRGKDYFAFTRLMEEFSIGLAFVDGEPAAVSCGAKHTVKIGGRLHPMITVSHLRVLPEHQRKGLWGAANKTLDKFWPRVDGSNAYISVDNLSMQHGFRNTPNKWPVTVTRLQLDCAALSRSSSEAVARSEKLPPPHPREGGDGGGAGAKAPAGEDSRPATPADVGKIVAMLNAFHGGEEMFVPYTEARFAARIARAPKQYSWDKIRMTQNALVGVWPAGDSLRVITETNGKRTESVRGLVLDYVFAPGGEKDFETLLRAWCRILAAQGMDRLSLFSSPNSPGIALLRTLASETEEFFMWSPGLPVPEGAETRGIYVDPVYF